MSHITENTLEITSLDALTVAAHRCGLELPVYRRIAAELERRAGRGAT